MPSLNAKGMYDGYVAGDPLTAAQVNNNADMAVSISGAQTVNGDKAFGGNDSFSNPVTFPSQLQVFTAGESITAGQPLCIAPYQSDGGIKYDAGAGSYDSTIQGATTGTKNVTFTVNHGGANSTLVVFVSFQTNPNGSSPNQITGVTWNGSAMTKSIGGTNGINGMQYGRGWMFTLQNPAQGTYTLAISWNNSGGGGAYNSTMAWQISNYYQTAGVDDAQSNSFGYASPNIGTVSIGGQNAGQVIVSAIMGGSLTNTVANNTANNLQNIAALSYFYMGNSGIVGLQTAVTITGNGHGNDGMPTALMSVALRPATTPANYIFQASSASPTPNACQFDRYKSFIGFATTNATVTQAVTAILSGIVTGLSGLIPMAQYYINNTNGTIGTSAGTNSRKIGIALSTTTLLLTNTW